MGKRSPTKPGDSYIQRSHVSGSEWYELQMRDGRRWKAHNKKFKSPKDAQRHADSLYRKSSRSR